MIKRRARELGLDVPGSPGPNNAITDIPGVLVGYKTLLEGSGPLRVGHGPVRTGVTAILPRGRDSGMLPTWAGFHALNGNGEVTGTHWIRDAGYFFGPICLTNTHSVGMVHHAVTRWLIDNQAKLFNTRHLWALPIVAETYDGVLNDINGQHVGASDVFEALENAADGAVAEGNVGGGTGMICYEFKGGTGTASRHVEIGGRSHTIGALVQANHGIRDWLTVLGAPVGRHLRDGMLGGNERGSVIVVIGTDIPMLPHQLRRLAQRATLGIARNGTPGGNNSGDMFLAFSVANPATREDLQAPGSTMHFTPDDHFDPIYTSAVQATEESVINALLAAEDMPTVKPAGRICQALDHQALIEIMARYEHLKSETKQ